MANGYQKLLINVDLHQNRGSRWRNMQTPMKLSYNQSISESSNQDIRPNWADFSLCSRIKGKVGDCLCLRMHNCNDIQQGWAFPLRSVSESSSTLISEFCMDIHIYSSLVEPRWPLPTTGLEMDLLIIHTIIPHRKGSQTKNIDVLERVETSGPG
jgi:hypothetical protein